MCMQGSGVRSYQRWHWAGDEIVWKPIVPAARAVPGTRKSRYPIDIREFLAISGNAVVGQTLQKIADALTPEQQLKFYPRKRGSFDFRAHKIRSFMSSLRYIRSSRTFDAWLFPEETLAQGGGDCEDLAFLFASLLVASGISTQCVRVVLGAIVVGAGTDTPKKWDHAWVVYLREDGAWEILEPLAEISDGQDAPADTGAARPLGKNRIRRR